LNDKRMEMIPELISIFVLELRIINPVINWLLQPLTLLTKKIRIISLKWI
jgi:hypothetical protein